MDGTSRLVRRSSSLVHSRLTDGTLPGSAGRCKIAPMGGGTGMGDHAATTGQRGTPAGAGENALEEGGRAATCEGDGTSAKVGRSTAAPLSGGALRESK